MLFKQTKKYSVFLFLTGKQEGDVFNTMTWENKRNTEGNSNYNEKTL